MQLSSISKENINTKDYWDKRFNEKVEGSWTSYSGESLTAGIAAEIAKRLIIKQNYEGAILDFGCALGDAIPVYKHYFPFAKFIGVDISTKGIELCKKKFGNIAMFYACNIDDIPHVDTIIASNVMEHITDNKEYVEKLLSKCHDLYIAVPYNEKKPLHSEHVHSYNKHSFDYLKINGMKVDTSIFICRLHGLFGEIKQFINIEVKNLIRPLFRRQKVNNLMHQILFHIHH
ncbi:hypothetical protein FACS1894137_09330 [Spirochaetia bacterium]|nr:hypothetical protein FACS1894137_09330 [Spirochaetia bacterium]